MSDIARPSNQEPLDEAGIYAACKAFVLTYGLPALAPDNIIQGWQNRAALPAGTNEYAVVSILFDRQHGTTVETFAASESNTVPPGKVTASALVEVNVQIDFCSKNDTARTRTRRLALVARSSLGVQFFNDRGMSCLYADDARDISFVGDAQQFVRRWMTTLRLTLWEGVSADFDYFNRVAISRLENVDVHHPPTGD